MWYTFCTCSLSPPCPYSILGCLHPWPSIQPLHPLTYCQPHDLILPFSRYPRITCIHSEVHLLEKWWAGLDGAISYVLAFARLWPQIGFWSRWMVSLWRRRDIMCALRRMGSQTMANVCLLVNEPFPCVEIGRKIVKIPRCGTILPQASVICL